MKCRAGCAACCVAPSITSYIPGMPDGKAAGLRCVQLADDNTCLLFEKSERPSVCAGLKPSVEMCGTTSEEAYANLTFLELATKPEK